MSFFVLAGVLRFVGLARFSFDGDEIFSIRVASMSWPALFRAAVNDVSHPPLYYVLLKLWLLIGPVSEAWVRALSALLGAAVFLPLYGICRRLRLSAVGTLVVLALFSVNGMLIYYAQDARMFPLLDLMSAISIRVFLEVLLTEKADRRLPLVLAAVNIPLVYSHYWGWVLVCSELIILGSFQLRKAIWFMVGTVGTALAFAPWAIAVMVVVERRGSLTRQIAWMTEPGAESPIWFLSKLDGAMDFPHSTSVGLLLFALPVLAMLWFMSRERRGTSGRGSVSPLVWIALFVLPLVITLLISYASGQSVWGERHLTMVAAPYFILMGVAVTWLRPAVVSMAFAGVLIFWAFGAGAAFLTDAHRKLEWSTIATAIAGQAGGDRPLHVHIIQDASFIGIPLQFYLNRMNERAPTLIDDDDIEGLHGDRFWLVFRAGKWPGRGDFAGDLRRRDLAIERQISISTKSQRIFALLVRHGGVGG